MRVLNALGRKHQLENRLRERIISSTAAVPTRVGRHRRKEGTDHRLDEEVTAFQAFDRAILVPVRRDRRPCSVGK